MFKAVDAYQAPKLKSNFLKVKIIQSNWARIILDIKI